MLAFQAWTLCCAGLVAFVKFFREGLKTLERTYRPQRIQMLFDASLGASLAQVRAIVETVAG